MVKVVESRSRRKEDFKLKILTQINYSTSPLRLLLGGSTLCGTYDKNWLTCSEFKMHIFLESDNDGIYNVQFVEPGFREYSPDGKLDLSNRKQIAEYTHVIEKISITSKEIMFHLDAFQIKHSEYCFYTTTSKQIAFVSQWDSLRKNHMREDDWMIPKFNLLQEDIDGLRQSDKVCYHELQLSNLDLKAISNFEIPSWIYAKIGERFVKVFKNYPSVPMPNNMTTMKRIILNIRELWKEVCYE